MLGVAALPVAVAVAQVSGEIDLLDAWVGVPVAFVLGVAALVASRRGGVRLQRTLGRAGGERAARIGRALGRLAIGIALAGLIAVAVYEALTRWAE